MPFMDGIQLLESIRELDADIPFILTTAHTESEYLINAIKFKATDYLVKPVNVKDLIQKAQIVCQEQQFENILQKFNLLGRDKLAIYEIDKLLGGMATTPTSDAQN